MNQQHSISVTQPVDRAIERVKLILFRPFDLGKWFVIGFCAWLTYLGRIPGNGFNFHLPGGANKHVDDVRAQIEHLRYYVTENLYWIVPVAAGVVILLLALGVLFAWLHSRGEFMFLDCVALNKAAVVEPWNKFAREGNSLFWFRIVLALSGMVLTWPLFILCGISLFQMFMDYAWNVHGVIYAVGLGMGAMLIGIVMAIIRKLTADFVVPIMYLRRKRCLDGWAEFRRLLVGHVGDLVLYFLFQILIVLALAIIVLAVVLVTCCTAGCLLALPYIGTVALLPVLIFKRSYSLFYLAQYGREYDVFLPTVTPQTEGPMPGKS